MGHGTLCYYKFECCAIKSASFHNSTAIRTQRATLCEAVGINNNGLIRLNLTPEPVYMVSHLYLYYNAQYSLILTIRAIQISHNFLTIFSILL